MAQILSSSARELPFTSESGNWCEASGKSQVFELELTTSSFADHSWLTADFYNPHEVIIQFKLQFVTSDELKSGEIIFALYPQVRARARFPATALALNAWLLPREGGLLKPMCGGDRVRPEEVRWLRLTVLAGTEPTTTWWQSPWKIAEQAPKKLGLAESPHKFLIDALGQPANRAWPSKTQTESAMVSILQNEAVLPRHALPDTWTPWGGSARQQFDATGFFRTHHDGSRWWLVDPSGGAFWSAGLCCVGPMVDGAISGLEHLLAWKPDDSPRWADACFFQSSGVNVGPNINFLAANLIRAFGPQEWKAQWEKLAANFMRRRRFNTIGNWSDWQLGKKCGIAYTRPLSDIDGMPVPKVFRDFPDVFAPEFEHACAKWAEQLRETRDDPAFLGYFICNEPTWSIAKQSPAEGMLLNTESAYSRSEFAGWLRLRYVSESSLASAWGLTQVVWTQIESGRWAQTPESPQFQEDARAFSVIMVGRLFDTLASAARHVDPNHLNLGARFAHTPPEWMFDALNSFDVFSFNSYSKKPRANGGDLSKTFNRPILIGEWHFGAPDTGMPAAGLESVATQEDRALAYRHFVEAHAAAPWCIGVHWFTLYDQSAIGRFDGEPYNCGFLDVCHREQTVLAEGAQASHELLYLIASGQIPVSDLPEPKYIRRLSL